MPLSSLQQQPLQTSPFELSHLVLVSTIDGKLHALARKTGKWLWSLKDPNHHSDGLIHRSTFYSHSTQQDQIYAIEPHSDGQLYLLIRSNSSSKLQKLPISVSQLVNLSPFTFPTDASKMFVGKKDTNMIGIDLKNGEVISLLRADDSHQQNGKAKQTSELIDPLIDPLIDQPRCSKQEAFSSKNHGPQHIDHRPRDLLYFGRTDYHISIYSKPNTLIQTLRYSTYSPSNLPNSLQSRWTRTPDETYLEPMHDGNLICFQFDRSSGLDPANPPLQRETARIKWQNSFDHPVTNVFDIAFLNQVSPNSPDYHHIPTPDPKPSSSDHPLMFFQPRLMPSHDFSSLQTFSSVYQQFNPAKNTPPDPNPHSDKAFLGKFEKSFFIMSQQNYPLVSFAPAAHHAFPNQDALGTHNLLDTGLASPHHLLGAGLDHTRLLDPSVATPLDHGSRHHPPLALDPVPPVPLLTAPKARARESSLTGTQSLSTPFSLLRPSTPGASQPIIQQRAAQISSLIVRRVKDQLTLTNPSYQAEDANAMGINPLLTIVFLAGLFVWLASKKSRTSLSSSSSSSHRWGNCLPSSSSDWSPFLRPANLLDYWLRGTHAHALQVPPRAPVDTKMDQPEGLQPIDDGVAGVLPATPASRLVAVPAYDQADETSNEDLEPLTAEPDSAPKAKAKAKRRRGKRPGQKAAAAAAKAEAEANLLPGSATLPAVITGSLADPVQTMKVPDGTKLQPLTPKPKLNLRKKKSQGLGVSVKENGGADGAPGGKAISYRPAELELGITQSMPFMDSSPLPFTSPISPSFQPERVGSLVITGETLGYGSHGTVVLKGTFQGRQVAIKRLLKDFVTLAAHEVSLLQESDDHPNVVRYFVKESLDNFLYIALELCQCSLFDLIERRTDEEISEGFNPKKALRQITSGLRYLHKLKIVHRDIKPQNILISVAKKRLAQQRGKATVRMLISDFGLCKKLELDESSFAQTANHAAGSFGYRAPEILRGQVNVNEQPTPNSTSSTINPSDPNSILSATTTTTRPTHRLTRSIDIFSLGCIFYYVLTRGEHPFGSRYEREVNILRDEICLDLLDGFDEEAFEAQQLIRGMICSNSRQRPTADQVLRNPYFWEPNKRLNFLCDSSDRFEIMERDPPDLALLRLEDLNKFNLNLIKINNSNANNESSLHLNWYKKVDKVLIENLGKYRKYDGDSVRDLLRVLRNKKHHFQDLPEGLKRTLGHLPEGFLNYFTRKFPSLLIHVHQVIEEFCGLEPMFEPYFLNNDEGFDDS